MKHDLHKLSEQYHLSESEQQVLSALLSNISSGKQCSVREFAAQNYIFPAAVIRLSKKLGFTGYTDMVYRIEFLLQNEIKIKNLTSEITSFIGDVPPDAISRYVQLLHRHRSEPILIAGAGFCAPLRDFLVRKLLVLGYRAIGTNSYEVYESNALQAGMMIAISKSGATDTILKPVLDSHKKGTDVVAFVGDASSPIAQHAGNYQRKAPRQECNRFLPWCFFGSVIRNYC